MLFKKPVFLQSINIIAFLATVAVNMLAGSTTLLNGVTSGEVSDIYPTLITPAGFTFAIWGIIYTLLLIFIVYQVMPKNRDQPFLKQIGILFALSGIWNISWLFLWHYELITYSLILMLALLATLISIYRRLNIGKVKVSLKERLAVHLPFSVYLGWISIATIANVSVALTVIGWDGWGIEPVTWAVAIIAIALLLSMVILATRKDIAYSLVVIWALAGIMAKQIDYQNIVLATEVSIAILLIAIAATAVVSKLRR
ncbi:MAG: tryptophan-rich sensory protein [Candidatus Bathyarchaeum sp.]|nr:MAG: tryptophan-rich sensory protein [Candidatus Bathyarchaeum sp.]